MRAASKVASTRSAAATFVAATLTVAALAGSMASTATASSGARTSSVGVPAGGAWVDLATLPQTLFGPATASDGTYVYAFGGYHFPEAVGSTLDTVYRYDPSANTWTTVLAIPSSSPTFTWLMAASGLVLVAVILLLNGTQWITRPRSGIARAATPVAVRP